MFIPVAISLFLSSTMIAVPQGAANNPSQDRTDVEKMKGSVQELVSTRGYRYSAQVTIMPGVAGTQHPNGTEDGDHPSEHRPTSIEFDGEFSRTQPLHLAGPDVDAYRLDNRVVFTDESDLWHLQSTPSALPGSTRDAHPVTGGTNQDHEADQHQHQHQRARGCQLWAACAVPAPHELLAQVDLVTATFQQSVEDGGLLSSDDLVYTTQLESRAIPAICLSVLGNADQMVCTLRVITNKKGAIKRVELQGTRESLMDKNASAVITRGARMEPQHDLTIHYSLKDIGDEVKLEIPQAALLLLDR